MSEELLNDSNEQVAQESLQEVVAPVSFKDSLPEDLRSDSSLADIKDIESLAKSYINAQRMLGSSVRIPGEDAGKEQLDAFYAKLSKIPGVARIDGDDKSDLFAKLGRPESPENYKIDLPEGVEIADPELLGDFRKLSHELGLTQEQVSKIAEFDLQREVARAEAMDRARTSAESELRSLWGADFNNRMEGAKATARVLSEQFPDAMQELIHGPAGNNPAFLSILSQLGSALQESGAVDLKGSVNYGTAPAEAMEKIDEIMGNKAHPYHNSADPGHANAVERVKALYALAYPQG